MRLAALLAAALLGACAPLAHDVPSVVAAREPGACRTGPHGGPPGARWTDRGIGGTGRPAGAAKQADRGIGGTGIVGVITGFGSVCVAGRELAYDDAVPVRLDGAPVSSAALRAGQLAAVEAAGPHDALRALGISVRHEVSGPVEAVDGDGALRVAGQRVAVTEQARAASEAATTARPGEWVAVSGLRRADDTIQATRLDRRSPGLVLVRGTLSEKAATWYVGALELRSVPVRHPATGRRVTASGRYEDGVLHVVTIADDVLAQDLPAYFGESVSSYVVEGYVSVEAGRLRLGAGLDAAASPGTDPFAARRAVVEFRRETNGSLRATILRKVAAAPPQPMLPFRSGGLPSQYGPSGDGQPFGGGVDGPGDRNPGDVGIEAPSVGPGPGMSGGGPGGRPGNPAFGQRPPGPPGRPGRASGPGQAGGPGRR